MIKKIPKDKNLIFELEIGTSDFINHHFKFWKYGKSDLQNKTTFPKLSLLMEYYHVIKSEEIDYSYKCCKY